MLDVGREAGAPVRPEATLRQLKDELEDPVAYFLGRDGSGVVFPTKSAEVYGFPPGRQFIFDAPEGWGFKGDGFEPLFGFAKGGLAEAWTAGCYPLSEPELVDFPFPPQSLFDTYGEVARRIGLTGDPDDDLAPFYPEHDGLLPPLPPDRHTVALEARYRRRRQALNRKGVYLGRTRVATLSRAFDDRPACTACGRCLWGCPTGALYTPSVTLRRCLSFPTFHYRPGVRVVRFESDGQRVTEVIGKTLADGSDVREPVERLALTAGALGTSEIVLRSTRDRSGAPRRLMGLMDNRQVLLPFLNMRRVGVPYEPESYQYHLLGMGLSAPDPRHYVHCQVTTLGTAMMHPIVQKLPFGMRAGGRVAALLHGALGLVNVNFHDTRREGNEVWLDPETGVLRMRYAPPDDETGRMAAALSKLKGALRQLGCIVPPGMTHIRPMGASVHYAGTLPMSAEGDSLTTDPWGRLRPFENVWIGDGASFPFLPAKNLTFTLMANATRIASHIE